jgi:hypothetical protein
LGSSRVNLTWTMPADNGNAITGYQISQQSNSVGPMVVMNADTLSTDTTATLTDLLSNTVYRFAVAAVNELGIARLSTHSDVMRTPPLTNSPTGSITSAPTPGPPQVQKKSVVKCKELGWAVQEPTSSCFSATRLGKCLDSNPTGYIRASALCAAGGSRLCHSEELLAGVGDTSDAQTCSLSEARVWTGTECKTTGGDMGFITQALLPSNTLLVPARCSLESELHQFGCCADQPTESLTSCEELEWPISQTLQGDAKVCIDAQILGMVCSSLTSLQGALSFCASEGARLCTPAEVRDHLAPELKCELAGKAVWTSTPCEEGKMLTQEVASSAAVAKSLCVMPSAQHPALCCADSRPITSECLEFQKSKGTNYCSNDAVCVDPADSDPEGSMSCVCPVSFTGPRCEDVVDFCANRPCGLAICVSLPKAYSCVCPDGKLSPECYTQPTPQTVAPTSRTASPVFSPTPRPTLQPTQRPTSEPTVRPDACLPRPCLNNATCLSSEVGPGVAAFVCTCAAGFTGDTCNIVIDACASSPCANGECRSSAGSFFCACPANFEGARCADRVDPCRANPCRNGVCVRVRMCVCMWKFCVCCLVNMNLFVYALCVW